MMSCLLSTMSSNEQIPSSQLTLHGALRQLQKGHGSKVLEALIAIRKKFIKEKGAFEKILSLGGVDSLLTIIEKVPANEKQADIALSILGNCCTDKKIADLVFMRNGLETIVNILKTSQNGSIQNRACRTLANMSQTSNCCSYVHEDEEIIEIIVKQLNASTDVDTQQTYARTLRLLADTGGHGKRVIEAEGLRAVAELLKSEQEAVILAGLKSVSHLTNCTKMDNLSASQLLGADVPASLHRLQQHTCDNISHTSFQLILAFVKQEEIRPALGSAGTIRYFMDNLLNNLEDPDVDITNETYSVINALCLCCRDAVNRVRIRELKGLQLLLDILQKDAFSRIHDRIISALVCFLYDDASFSVLLDNGVVPVLLQHLRNRAALDSMDADTAVDETKSPSTGGKCKPVCVVPDVDNETSVNAMLEADQSASITGKVEVTPVKGRTISKRLQTARARFRSKGLRLCASAPGSLNLLSESNTDSTAEFQPTLHEVESEVMINIQSQDNASQVKDPESPRSECSDGISTMKAKPTYSINSPTYQQVLEWKLEDYNIHSMKRDSIFEGSEGPSSPANIDVNFSPSHSGPYSPMSVASYMSSECCSVEYSPPSSPLSALAISPPASPVYLPQSTGMSPDWSPVRCQSPASPRSPWWYKGEMPDDILLYSSDEDEEGGNDGDCRDSVPEVSEIKNESISETFLEILNDDPVYNEAINESDFGKALAGGSLTRQASIASHLDEEGLCMQPKAKRFKSVNKKVLSEETKIKIQDAVNKNLQSCETENDSFDKMLCTRSDSQSPGCSQRDIALKDPNKITEHNIIVLLSRVSYLENPSKYLVNASCLETLCKYIKQVTNPLPRCSRLLLRLTRNFLCLEAMILAMAPSIFDLGLRSSISKSDDPPLPSSDSQLPALTANVKGNTENTSLNENSTICTERRGVKRKHVSSEETPESEPSSLQEKSSLLLALRRQLLNNMACVAESRFGKGTILSILQKGTHMDRESCAVCLPYMCRSNKLQQKFLLEHNGLKLLKFIMTNHSGEDTVFKYAAESMTWLGLSSIAPKSTGSTNIPEKTRTTREEEIECDLTFIVKGEEIKANRSKTASSSDVFAAMLEGHYSESESAVISIPDCSYESFSLVIKSLHDTGVLDECMEGLQAKYDKEEVLEFLLEAVCLCDRYNLSECQAGVCELVSSQYLESSSVDYILDISVMHNCDALAVECIQYILSENMDVKQRLLCFDILAHGYNSASALDHFFKTLECNI